jgi:hypothetical protein
MMGQQMEIIVLISGFGFNFLTSFFKLFKRRQRQKTQTYFVWFDALVVSIHFVVCTYTCKTKIYDRKNDIVVYHNLQGQRRSQLMFCCRHVGLFVFCCFHKRRRPLCPSKVWFPGLGSTLAPAPPCTLTSTLHMQPI